VRVQKRPQPAANYRFQQLTLGLCKDFSGKGRFFVIQSIPAIQSTVAAHSIKKTDAIDLQKKLNPIALPGSLIFPHFFDSGAKIRAGLIDTRLGTWSGKITSRPWKKLLLKTYEKHRTRTVIHVAEACEERGKDQETRKSATKRREVSEYGLT